jgi:hypothetical protein
LSFKLLPYDCYWSRKAIQLEEELWILRKKQKWVEQQYRSALDKLDKLDPGWDKKA